MLATVMYEFVVVVFMRFLMAALEGVTYKSLFDPSLRVVTREVEVPLVPGSVPLVSSPPRHTGVLVLLPVPNIDAISSFRVFDPGALIRFDAGRTLLFVYRSCEVKIALVSKESEIFLVYSFEIGRVFPVHTYHQGTRSWP